MEEKEFAKELKYVKKNRFRETTEWWDTTHNSTYDIKNGKLRLTVHERYVESPHEFSF